MERLRTGKSLLKPKHHWNACSETVHTSMARRHRWANEPIFLRRQMLISTSPHPAFDPCLGFVNTVERWVELSTSFFSSVLLLNLCLRVFASTSAITIFVAIATLTADRSMLSSRRNYLCRLAFVVRDIILMFAWHGSAEEKSVEQSPLSHLPMAILFDAPERERGDACIRTNVVEKIIVSHYIDGRRWRRFLCLSSSKILE